ncbi:MAG: Sir2 family NAD-dependent protein deacetylase [Acidimicrobiales bacterium]|jgi:NAD-dependent deacetylase
MSDVAIGQLKTARASLRRAQRVIVLTGAGISTASGIPDYRGPQGVWTRNPAAERASHIDVYSSDPEVREASWSRLLMRAEDPPQPNEAHRSLARFGVTGWLGVLVTQNIDGLHLAAGTPPERLIEIHGHVRAVRCLTCSARQPTGDVLARVAAGDADPRCDVIVDGRLCGGVLATTIVRFGEQPDPLEMHRAKRAARESDLMMCVGTTLTVYPVAGLVQMALDYDAQLIIVNDAPTPYDDRAICVRGDITEVLPTMLGDVDSYEG